MAHLEKVSDLRSRIGAAEAAGAMLDGPRARLEYGGLPVEEATQEYREILAGISFVPERQVEPTTRSQTQGPRGGAMRPVPGESRPMWQFTVVLLATALLFTAAIGLTRGLVGAGTGGSGPTTPPSSSGDSAPTAPSISTPSPSEEREETGETGDGVFGGRTEDGSASLAIVTGAGQAAAYVCDGRQFEAWLQGSVVDGRLELTGQNGASLTGVIGEGAISGEFCAPALSTPFVAGLAAESAGVYEARIQVNGADARVGWAVLPDGSQVGVVNIGGTRSAAPRLNVNDRTFMLNGVNHQAERLEP